MINIDTNLPINIALDREARTIILTNPNADPLTLTVQAALNYTALLTPNDPQPALALGERLMTATIDLLGRTPTWQDYANAVHLPIPSRRMR